MRERGGGVQVTNRSFYAFRSDRNVVRSLINNLSSRLTIPSQKVSLCKRAISNISPSEPAALRHLRCHPLLSLPLRAAAAAAASSRTTKVGGAPAQSNSRGFHRRTHAATVAVTVVAGAG